MNLRIVRRFPLFKSTDVGSSNSHKLYWIDIFEDKIGHYIVKTYAQVFSKDLIPEKPREYNIHRTRFIGDAVKVAEDKIRQKLTSRGYIKISDRDISDVAASNEDIIKFLSKYA